MHAGVESPSAGDCPPLLWLFADTKVNTPAQTDTNMPQHTALRQCAAIVLPVFDTDGLETAVTTPSELSQEPFQDKLTEVPSRMHSLRLRMPMASYSEVCSGLHLSEQIESSVAASNSREDQVGLQHLGHDTADDSAFLHQLSSTDAHGDLPATVTSGNKQSSDEARRMSELQKQNDALQAAVHEKELQFQA